MTQIENVIVQCYDVRYVVRTTLAVFVWYNACKWAYCHQTGNMKVFINISVLILESCYTLSKDGTNFIKKVAANKIQF